MKTVVIIQARSTSTRLPSKVLLPIESIPMVVFQLKRVKRSKQIDSIVLATSDQKSDDTLARTVEAEGFKVFRGDLEDVFFYLYLL